MNSFFFSNAHQCGVLRICFVFLASCLFFSFPMKLTVTLWFWWGNEPVWGSLWCHWASRMQLRGKTVKGRCANRLVTKEMTVYAHYFNDKFLTNVVNFMIYCRITKTIVLLCRDVFERVAFIEACRFITEWAMWWRRNVLEWNFCFFWHALTLTASKSFPNVVYVLSWLVRHLQNDILLHGENQQITSCAALECKVN